MVTKTELQEENDELHEVNTNLGEANKLLVQEIHELEEELQRSTQRIFTINNRFNGYKDATKDIVSILRDT